MMTPLCQRIFTSFVDGTFQSDVKRYRTEALMSKIQSTHEVLTNAKRVLSHHIENYPAPADDLYDLCVSLAACTLTPAEIDCIGTMIVRELDIPTSHGSPDVDIYDVSTTSTSIKRALILIDKSSSTDMILIDLMTRLMAFYLQLKDKEN